MDKITISNGVTTITMPRVKAIQIGGQEVASEITMADITTVKEMRGFRLKISAEWDWLPAATIANLHAMLRQGGFFEVSYPDVDGTFKTGMFSVNYPTTKVFRFINGVPRWHGVALTMTGQGAV